MNIAVQNVKLVDVTKNEIDQMINTLTNKITMDALHIDYVVGIERGGIHISKPVSKILGVPHKSIRISFYKEGTMRANTDPEVDFHGHKFNVKDNVLVVDDLIDNGHTVKYFQENIACQSKIAVLYWNKKSHYNVKPDYYVEEKLENTWLRFYWEKK